MHNAFLSSHMPSCSRVPPGTSASIHTWCVHRDERNFFPAPNSFWPDRWLIAAGKATYKGSGEFVHNSDAFIPFSFGPANCVGKTLAMQEMRMVVCGIMQKFHMKFADGWDPYKYQPGQHDYFTMAREKLSVTFSVR